MKRQRGRGGQGGGQRRPGQGNNSNRSFDSNGPDVKVRGPASHIYERYMQLARDANSAGDRIQAENFLQHAEHYYRVFRAMQPVAPAPQLTERYGEDIDFDGDENTGEGEEGGEGEARQEQHAQQQRGEYRERDQRRDYQQQPREHRGDYQQRDRGEYRDRDQQQRGEYRERGNGEYRDRDQQRGEYRGDRQDNRDRPDNRDRVDSRDRQDRDQPPREPRENAEGGEQVYTQGAPQGAAEGQDGEVRRNRRGRRNRYREGGPRPEGEGGESAPETGGFGEAAPAFLTND